MVFLVPFLLLIAELVWQKIIGYPPTLELLRLGVGSPAILWLVRLLGLVLILTATFFFSSLITNKAKKYYWVLTLGSPILSLLWMSYPLDAIKIFLISGAFYLLARRQKSFAVATTVSIAILLILNLFVFKQNPKILDALSLPRSQEEVTYRFTTEDKSNPHIEIPILLRRIGYNKYFILLKNSLNESLNFFDFETIFFQEVHPMNQKAFVIFFWPEIFIFSLGIWLSLNKRLEVKKGLLSLLLISFIYFITTSASAERRLTLTLYPLAIIMAGCLNTLFTSGSKKIRVGIIILLFLTFYGWTTNYYDRYIRPAYWLDNHPIAYDFFLSYLKNQNEKYDQIVVPDTLYAAKEYCTFYLKDCTSFKNENFDLSKQSFKNNTLYIGFIGNFVGPNPENSFDPDISSELNNKGMEILQKTRLPDNIANGYGQDILIVRAKR